MGLAAFPLVIKNHYIALCRIEQRIAPTLLPLTICCALELIASATGAHVGGLVGGLFSGASFWIVTSAGRNISLTARSSV